MKYKLGDVALFNPTENIKKGDFAKKVAMDKLQSFCRDIPSFEITEYNGGTKFRNGDTVMARITPCLENGKTAKVNFLEDGEVGFGSTEYIVFRAIDGITDEDYLYYLVCSPVVRDIAIKSMVGSSGRQRVQTDVVKSIEIELPSFDIQKRIGSLLKSLDDKIAINNRINNLFSDVKEEFSLFDPKFLEEISKMKEKNLAVELLKKLIAEQVHIYKRTNVVKSEKFSEIIQEAMNRYLNGMLTNEQVIEELINLAKQIAVAQKEGEQLGLTADELAFYDALTKPQAIKDFYENEELIAITKELTETLRRNKTIDWQKRESARAKMRMLIKKLLKKHKYPPEGMEDAVQTVMTQCELWTDNNDMSSEENVVDFRKAGYTYVQEDKNVLMVAEERVPYGETKK